MSPITATINSTLRTFQGDGRPRYRAPLGGGETRGAAGLAVARAFSSTRTEVEEFFVIDTILLSFCLRIRWDGRNIFEHNPLDSFNRLPSGKPGLPAENQGFKRPEKPAESQSGNHFASPA
jgi:hypothetical protein